MEIIDIHNSWLVINSIVGCTNNCKYCLLNKKDNKKEPQILCSPKEAIKKLKEYKFYDANIPLCLFPNTDIFLNEKNKNYLLEILKEIEKQQIKNDLILITKCLIPTNILNKIQDRKKKGQNVIVYLSYSGLSNKIEPNIRKQDILTNFKNLQKYKIPTVHYYRPFLFENGKKENIKKILEEVHTFTPISVTTGFMYLENRINDLGYKNSLDKYKIQNLQNATSIWPKEAWDYFYKEYNSSQFFYQTNTCALNAILKKPSPIYYNTYECKHLNHCNKEQQERCKKAKNKRKKKNTLEKLNQILDSFAIPQNYKYKFKKEGSLELQSSNIDLKTLIYLSHKLNQKIFINNQERKNNNFNSTLNGAKPLIIRSTYERDN